MTGTQALVQRPATPLAAIRAWLMVDWAAQPFFTLVLAFAYAPFFANAIVADPVRGQALWGYATAAAGALIAIGAPVLGAIADASGHRKRWIAAFAIVFAVACSALWAGKPGDAASIGPVLMAYGLAAVAVNFTVVFTNAMMPDLVPVARAGRLSGLGTAIGSLGGLVSVFVALAMLIGDPQTGKTVLETDPAFGLDATAQEGTRALGPFAAVWFAVFILPLFLFTRDTPGRLPLMAAVRAGLSTLGGSLRELPHHRDLALFLLACMLYTDGLTALFAFSGIFASSGLGWTSVEEGLYGVLTMIAGIFGALLGAAVIDRIGPKAVVLAMLALIMVALLCMIVTEPDHIGQFAVDPPVEGDGLFASPSEMVILVIGALIGTAFGGLYASSRTMLVRLAPQGRFTEFFGLFAFAGNITAFVGPLLVAVATEAFSSQNAGVVVLIVMFGAAILAMLLVQEPKVAPAGPA